MPKPKKASANWYIAATHYLTAGFAIPFIGGLALGFVHSFVLPALSDVVSLSINAIESAILVYLGVMYGAKYVNRTYVIADASKIVKLATTYYVVLAAIGWTATLFFLSVVAVPTTILGIGLVSTVVNVIIFYMMSAKLVKAGQ